MMPLIAITSLQTPPLVTDAKLAALPAHPRLLATKAELEAAKRKPENKAFLDGLLARAETLSKKPVVLPERGGQWPHWYACKTHGARLKTESPTRHVCPVDGQVYTGWPYDDVPLLAEHNDWASALRDLGLAYQLSGERRYAQKAREILLAYAVKYPGYAYHDKDGKTGTGGGKVGPQTLDEAVWLIPMAQGADLVWETLSESERATLKTDLFFPAAEVIRKHKMGVHNIQCWKNSAVGLVALLYGDKALLAEAIDDPERGLQRQLREGITDDGPWYEGAWSYHFYTMSALAPLMEAGYHAGLPLYSGTLGERYKKLYLAAIRMALPGGQLPAFNDSNAATAMSNPLYETAFVRFQDPQLALPLTTSPRKTLPAFLAGAPPLPATASQTLPSEVFAAVGYAYLRAPGATLILKYGPHGGGHGHADKLNTVFFAGGKTLLDDPGTSVYGIPAHLGWYKTTLAHNTFVQAETNQAPATGRLLDFKTGTGWAAALADAGAAYEGTTLQRAAFLLGSDTAVFVDHAEQKAPGLLDLAIHPSFEPKSWLMQPGDVQSLPDKPGYRYLQAAKQTSSFSSYTDSSGFALSLVPLTTPTRYVIATGMGKSSEDRVPILLARTVEKSARWVWAIAPRGTTLTARTRGEEVLVEVNTPGKRSWQLRVTATTLDVK
ncbi:heparinase II/III domain-containing protein [Armatimonas rosea]|uniref:Alginate lyase n=1 Tax=Armatimonas rosea TaxID=685828 RepID=A0A7W9W3C1_ARMRO|nr:heparinase II/III family protein [Armatimonas rosea]MBB6048259.1 hypothetical protein [Armatimonas rosea]